MHVIKMILFFILYKTCNLIQINMHLHPSQINKSIPVQENTRFIDIYKSERFNKIMTK